MKTELYYAAGFFDGEGSIYFTKQVGKSGNPNIYLTCTVTNTNRDVVWWFHETFGGVFGQSKDNRTDRRVVWRCRWQTGAAFAFLEQIGPYLRVKREQAEIALAHERVRRANMPIGRRPKATPEEVSKTLAFYNDYRSRFGQLNHPSQQQRLSEEAVLRIVALMR